MTMAKLESSTPSKQPTSAGFSGFGHSGLDKRDHHASELLQHRLELVEDLWKTVLKSECPPEQTERLLRLKQLSDPITVEDEEVKVLIDRVDAHNYYGRTEQDSPEVDNEVIIPSNEMHLRVGDFYKVIITDSKEYDLIGKIL